MKILGADLSLTSTGLAWWDALGPHSHVVKTKPTEPLHKRLSLIVANVKIYEPDVLIAESVPTHGAFSIVPLAMVHGAVHYALGLPTVYVTVQQLKMFATGKGDGKKIGISVAAGSRLGYTGSSDDEVDALWLMHLGHHLFGDPKIELPQSHLRALESVRKSAAKAGVDIDAMRPTAAPTGRTMRRVKTLVDNA